MNPIKSVKRIRQLVLELPQQLQLAYCLARDPRTPALPKAALIGALAVILNPAIDIPIWIPVVGQMDAIALTVLAVRTYNQQAPAELRLELGAEIKAHTSRFDRDLRAGVSGARHLATLTARLPGHLDLQAGLGGARQLAQHSSKLTEKLPFGHREHPSEVAEVVAPWYRSPDSTGGSAEGEGLSQPTLPGPSHN